MSSHWSATSGTGLVLSLPEFTAMIEKYKTLNPGEAENVTAALKNGGVPELRLVASKNAGTAPAGFQSDARDAAEAMSVRVDEVSDDFAEGGAIWPFYRPDGSPNVRGGGNDAIFTDPSDGKDVFYVSWSDRSMYDALAFDKKPYASYEQFKQEFKDKFKKYLPEDFDWDAHLGVVAYAVYA